MKIGHLVLGIFLILSIMSIFGQVNTSAILGTVTDPTGAVIPGATVVVTNVETGVASRAVTDNLGNYAARFLPPGRYRVDAESAGFKKFIRQDITLDSTREL